MPHPSLPRPLPLIADGGVAAQLERVRPGRARPVEELSLTHPEQVRALHKSFLAAGATLHRTNTRGAHGFALAPFALEERGEAINNSGSALLREAIGEAGRMMGSIGEIPGPEGGGTATVAERERGYGQQLVCLSDTGVTFFLLEHFSRVEEVLRVLRIAQSASDAPVLAQMRFDAQGRSGEGMDCAEVAARLEEGGAGALGISCGPAPEAWPPLLETLTATGLPVSVMLGLATPGAAPPYPGAPALTPAQFALALAPLAERGVAILGGCCGAGPEHIRALAEQVATQRVASPPGEAAQED